MWFKIIQSVLKELKLLFRDFGGLIILFLMPVVLVVVVTSIQDSTFQSIGASKIPVLWVDNDNDSISHQIKRDRKSTRLNSSHVKISYAVFCLKKKKKT